MVHQFQEDHQKVFIVKPDQPSPLPVILQWLEARMEDLTYCRQFSEEGYILYCCLPTMGVVSSLKLAYVHQLITGFMAARPSNSICVVIHANRASESKKQPETQFMRFYSKCQSVVKMHRKKMKEGICLFAKRLPFNDRSKTFKDPALVLWIG